MIVVLKEGKQADGIRGGETVYASVLRHEAAQHLGKCKKTGLSWIQEIGHEREVKGGGVTNMRSLISNL